MDDLGAATFCTGTLVNVQRLLDKYNLRSKIICYIHDAVYLDCPPEELDTAINILNSAFNKIATEKYGLPTASDTEFGISMGSACGIERISKWHYRIEGNAVDVADSLEQLEKNYSIEVVSDHIGEVKNIEDDVSWIFNMRQELKFFDEVQDREIEVKLTPNF